MTIWTRLAQWLARKLVPAVIDEVEEQVEQRQDPAIERARRIQAERYSDASRNAGKKR